MVSCSENRVYQCKKIISITQEIAKESQANRKTEDIQEALQVADSFEKAAAEMRNLSISDENLVKYQLGFANIYQGYAQTTRKFILALQKRDINTVKLMQQQLQQLGQKEPKLGNRMNSYCQSK
ncbi:hypothetical protein [cyanobacterium endosymbiont of Rhopalodia gibberula]|uniref:hypothetical protein n=1 Tax=cyanobacterium endosymbiont of Rhopalodia gibberula TaxID=1763363 RepID=UPI001E310D31|nr:hypothetical protein [cyanobacterium endosymbiont of Rhopalodia gibberula]